MSLKCGVWTIIPRMIVMLQTERLHTVEQIRAFLEGIVEVDFKPEGRGRGVRLRPPVRL